jgi:hypothetical protein
MHFESTSRILAFPASAIGAAGHLTELYGAELPTVPLLPDSPVVRCLVGGLDREGSNDLRGLELGTTAITTPLSDGRHAYAGYWTVAAMEAVAQGIVEAEEITEEQFKSLLPPTPDQ